MLTIIVSIKPLNGHYPSVPGPDRYTIHHAGGKTLHIETLKAQLAALRRARFGRKSEKLDREIEQLELLIGDLEEGQAESAAKTEAAQGDEQADKPATSRTSSSPARRGRKPLPEHLTRERVIHTGGLRC